MLELLKFEYKRILTCKPLYFIVAAAVILPLAAGIGLNVFFDLMTEGSDLDILTSGNTKFFTWFVISYFYTRLPIFIALFTSLFLGRDFKDGFIRNKITAGHSRLTIYASALITQISVTTALSAIYVLVGIITMALSPLGANINNGEMLVRALVLLLSLVGMTTLFTTLTMIMKSRALATVLCVVFVMGLGIMNSAAYNYCYSEQMVDDYIEACEDKMDEFEELNDYGYSMSSYYTLPEKKDYINYGWYVCHPIYVLTNAGMESDIMANLETAIMVEDSDDVFTYPKKVSHAGFVNSIMSMLFNNTYNPLTTKELNKIDGMVVRVDDLLVAYTIKSLVWTAIFAGAGYAIFRKRNIN